MKSIPPGMSEQKSFASDSVEELWEYVVNSGEAGVGSPTGEMSHFLPVDLDNPTPKVVPSSMVKNQQSTGRVDKC